ncbi:hypothetical protein PW5551_03125 [Petrotoga sp. 9PW.55.5.1]|jgi:predicted XRE-type DNA-binding protein|uniref:hypothetical protein n=1 Tax=Petrotoga sp. 9PW.55.5.1 TaxID=1308979 RepID=UPI000DC3D3D7|nr:hypothetical protein [Petrotoga sp. 9PW.55.5.1]RAO99496.1 hypothetical protein PW5551_03125 [Petrotoga sp. 9PW.55.5.1]
MIKAYWDKDINNLIEKSKYSKEQIAKELKIPIITLENLINGQFDTFTKVSLFDISKRLSSLLGEEVNIIFKEEYEKEEKKEIKKVSKNLKVSFYRLIITCFLIVNLVFLYFLIKDLRYYNNVLKRNIYTLNIINNGPSQITVGDKALEPKESLIIELPFGEKIEFENNQGETLIETPIAKYSIKIENFEVSLTYGED